MSNPITVLDVVRSVVGDKESYSGEDFDAADMAMTGGCQACAASIAAYNAYPSRTGFWLCRDCINDLGFDSVETFRAWENDPVAWDCGGSPPDED